MILRNWVQKVAARIGTLVGSGVRRARNGMPAAAILASTLLFSGSVPASERVENGSFEMPSPMGWEDGAGVGNDIGFDTYNYSQVYYEGPAIPASYDPGETYGWRWGFDNGNGAFGTATQSIDVSGDVGQPYVFSAWLAAYTQNDDHAEVSLEWRDADGMALGGHLFDGDNNMGSVLNADGTGPGDWTIHNWSLYAADGTVPAGAASAAIVIAGSATNSNGNDAYVDLVSLDIVPEPGAAWLLAWGSLFLVRRR